MRELDVICCEEEGSLRRAGGQGDVLAGLIGTFTGWAVKYPPFYFSLNCRMQEPETLEISPLMLAAFAGCTLTRLCSRAAFQKNQRSTVAHDLIPFIGPLFNQTFEHKSDKTF